MESLFLEVRAGAGGDDAKQFADELCSMYVKFANKQGYKSEMVDENIILIKGRGCL